MTDPRTTLNYVVEFKHPALRSWKMIGAFLTETDAERFRNACRAEPVSSGAEYRMRDLTPSAPRADQPEYSAEDKLREMNQVRPMR